MDVERGVPVVHEKDFDGDPVEDGGVGEIRIIIYFKYGKRRCVKMHTFFFYAQNPDFHKQGLCYYLKILYL